MNGEYIRLARRLRAELENVERVVSRALSIRNKAKHSGDDDYWDGVALNLHDVYMGLEHAFEDIAKTLDESVPTSAEWHRDLLLQMADEVAAVRPPVIQRDTLRCLDEYGRFRHFIRNVYTTNLQSSRLDELVTQLHPCFDDVKSEFEAFMMFLEQAARTDIED